MSELQVAPTVVLELKAWEVSMIVTALNALGASNERLALAEYIREQAEDS